MKRLLNIWDILILSGMIALLTGMSVLYSVLRFIKTDTVLCLIIITLPIVLFCGLAILLGIRIARKIKKIANSENVSLFDTNEILNKLKSLDFIFSLNDIWPDFSAKKYTPSPDSQSLLSRLKKTDSVSEAQKIALDLHLASTIKTGNLPCFLIKQLFRQTYDVLTHFPHMKSAFVFLGSMSELLVFLNKFSGAPLTEINKIKTVLTAALNTLCMRAIAFQIGHTVGIAINDNIYSNPINAAKDDTNRLNETASGVFPPSCKTIKSVIDHEIGHIFDFVLGVSSSKSLSAFLEKIPAQEIKRELGSYALSDYANKRELVAVAYADRKNTDSPSFISLKICELINLAYKKRFPA